MDVYQAGVPRSQTDDVLCWSETIGFHSRDPVGVLQGNSYGDRGDQALARCDRDASATGGEAAGARAALRRVFPTIGPDEDW
jgi:hypothetical protein